MDALTANAYADPFDIVIGEIKLNLMSQTMLYRGRCVPLSPLEYRIAEYLFLRKGTPISRLQLAKDITTRGDPPNASSVGVITGRLRAKLGEGACYLPTVPDGRQKRCSQS